MRNKIVWGSLLISMLLMLIVPANARDIQLEELEIISDINKIEIDAGGAEIIFDDTSDKLYISEELKTEVIKDRLYIRRPKKFLDIFEEKKCKIILGTKKSYSTVEIDAAGAMINGVLKADHIEINGGGLMIDDAYFCADKISFDGAGLSVDANLDTKYLDIDGAGMLLDLELLSTREAEFDGAGISGDIKYLDDWIGNRYLSFDGVAGAVEIFVIDKNTATKDGKLKIDSDGFIDIDVNYY